MSKLTKKDMHTPFNSATITKLMGIMQRCVHEQATAADDAARALPGASPANHSGKVRSIFIVLAVLPASGESMSYDVLVNGVSILSAPFVATDTSVTEKYTELTVPAAAQINEGDLVTVTRDYTAGGGPAMTKNTIGVEWS
jgi:hypothetical protein